MGTVSFNTDVDKTVDIIKNVELNVDKQVNSVVDLDGALATAEASADALAPTGGGGGGGPQGLAQLFFLIDGSGSIDATEFAIQIDGLADAIRNTTSFPYEITVIQFGTGADVEIDTRLITSAQDASDVADDIEMITQIGGNTNISAAIDLAVQTLQDAGFNPADTQLINLASDGGPQDLPAAQASALAAQAFFDGLSTEGIGGGADLTALDSLVFPGPGVILDPFDPVADFDAVPDPRTVGFTLAVDDFMDFGPAVEAKLAEIFDDDGAADVLAEVDTFSQVSSLGAFAFAESLSALDMA